VPVNAAAEAEVARFWRGDDASVSNSNGTSTGTLGTAERPYTFQVPYSILHNATGGFGKSMRIGGGGSCSVYKAQVFGVSVAVKVLTLAARNARNQKKQASEEQQFVAEMQLLTKVQHANICRLLGVSSDGPQGCLVLEMFRGGALKKALQNDGRAFSCFSCQKRLATADGGGNMPGVSALAHCAPASSPRCENAKRAIASFSVPAGWKSQHGNECGHAENDKGS
jgi:hypothetical protein